MHAYQFSVVLLSSNAIESFSFKHLFGFAPSFRGPGTVTNREEIPKQKPYRIWWSKIG